MEEKYGLKIKQLNDIVHSSDLTDEEKVIQSKEIANDIVQNLTPEETAKIQEDQAKMKEQFTILKDECFKLVQHCMYEICLFKGYTPGLLSKHIMYCHETANHCVTVEAVDQNYKFDLYTILEQRETDHICSKLLSLVQLYYKEMCEANNYEYEKMQFDTQSVTLNLSKSDKFPNGKLRFGIKAYTKAEFNK